MSDTKKDISVQFVKYEPYEHFPDVIVTLGNISNTELNEIMNTFATRTVAQNACIQTMYLDHNDHTSFGRALGSDHRNQSLELSNMFYYDTMPKCGKQNCKLDEEAKIKRCARNLKNGKCCDDFIRNTLGAILYPQHYATDKQK